MYSVGITEDGRTVLTLGDEGYTSKLTMNYDGVIQLIRLLEATLPEYKEEKDDQSNRNGYNYSNGVNVKMNEIVRWIMTPLEVISFVFFLTMLMVGGFVVLPYYFIRYGYGECKARK